MSYRPTPTALAGAFLAAGLAISATAPIAKLQYPAGPRGSQVDDYHGIKVADPYRILENADSPATQKWIEQENALTFGWLAKQPGRETIRQQLTGLWNFERFAGLYKVGGHYFYSHNTGLQNQSVVHVMDSLNGPARELLDPNTYRKDGTAALAGESVSWNGKLFAYAVAQAGSDWDEWRVRDVATGKDLPDLIRWVKDSSASWSIGDGGFYYSRYPEPPADQVLTVAALNQKIYYHKLGDPQSADKLIYERPEHPSWGLGGEVMEGSHYFVIVIYTGDPGKNLLSYMDLNKPNAKPVDLIPQLQASYSPIAVTGSLLYLQTNDSAPRGRVIAIDLTQPDRAHWKEIVPQKAETLDSVQMADGRLLLSYMKDAHSIASLMTAEGKPVSEIAMPGIGTASWSPAMLGQKEMFFGFGGYTIPPGVYRLDLQTGKTSVVRQSKVAFDASAYETKQVFYNSKDGTRVPMFLNYRKGLKLDGQNPTVLYAYGGFNIAETPAFSTPIAEWMSMGGVYAVANVRGGSEYGEAWHQAGMRAKKQNVFDDFISAAEWLIANKYTSTPKLAIYGSSNGGLLIGAVLDQRPELFGAAMPDVGVMDMLRFNKFGFGTQWVGEYGSPENPDDFKILRTYSPLQNVRKAVYPPTLITTSDHDDRVMPGHSLKFAATLQQAQEGPAPILLRVETRAGHGAGKPTSKRIDEWADRLTFLNSALKMN
ncbi:MAG TPA: prolyl oligopeptidase family serine peptidase [Bryobacteraceae bacterium]|nr:prolyl oligopeptidase family serine peptidase [Bryobacteraceae bacterium]